MNHRHEHHHKITLGRPMSRFAGDRARYRTSAYQERDRVKAALRKGVKQLRAAGMHEDAHLVKWVVSREWCQRDLPVTAYVTDSEWKALSRALRSDAYSISERGARAKMLQTGAGELGSVYNLLVKRKEY